MYSMIIADDHALFREGLKTLLLTDKRFQVTGEAEDGEQALELILKNKPEVAVLDVALPKMSGITVVQNVSARKLSTRCIMLTMHEEPEIALSALSAGAQGYILKGHTFDELKIAVEQVLSGKKFISPKIAGMVFDAATRQKDQRRLTKREREILELVSQGISNVKIAELLHISEKTVSTHKTRVMAKLDIHSTPELVRYMLMSSRTSSL